MQRWIFALAAFAGCVRSQSVACGENGALCPEGRVCDRSNTRCLTPDQATGCADLSEGDLCSADSRAGRCSARACVPDCGDGVLDAGEECDDGNYINHDGCTSTCVVEALSWEQWEDPWQPRAAPAAAYDSTRARLVVFGGFSSKFHGDTWERSELAGNVAWTRVATTGPSARKAVMAYDPIRNVTVLFGGCIGGVDRYDDTWEFDGANWQPRTLAMSPPARCDHAMAFDENRGKIVLFGGTDLAGQPLGDTWTYDGTWTQIASNGPPARYLATLAYDTTRDKLVLYGGTPFVDNNVWELGATGSWTSNAIPPAPNGPSPRFGMAMAYVTPAGGPGALILFGGFDGNANPYSDTWKYDGAWSRATPDDQPTGSFAHTLTSVLDPDGGVGARKVVLVGGATVDTVSDQIWDYRDRGALAPRWTPETPSTKPKTSANPAVVDRDGTMTLYDRDLSLWAFDGVSWSVRTSMPRPPARTSYTLAYHAGLRKLVMHGGESSGNDTWTFDGVSWENLGPAGPVSRTRAVAAYDVARGVVVMVGGQSTMALAETWEFDGAWHAGAPAPMPQVDAAMAYDPIRARMVLLATNGSTWTFDGAWAELPIPPFIRAAASMTFDPLRGRLVVFGGREALALSAQLYELTEGGWTHIDVVGTTPDPRRGASFASVASARALVVSGGQVSTLTPNDTWLLTYHSATPDEVCDDGLDNDGDERVDGDDPDCL